MIDAFRRQLLHDLVKPRCRLRYPVGLLAEQPAGRFALSLPGLAEELRTLGVLHRMLTDENAWPHDITNSSVRTENDRIVPIVVIQVFRGDNLDIALANCLRPPNQAGIVKGAIQEASQG